MSEWWTYRLSDFLMFSPRTYWRLVELHNRDVWPAHVLTLAAGLAALGLAATRRAGAGRLIALLLAAAWLWVGWAFHWQRYATINWAAQAVAAAFMVQAVLLLGAGLLPAWGPSRPADALARSEVARSAGLALAIAGVLLYPLAGIVVGRPWTQAECFGIAPEPTALVTLGLLLATRHPSSSTARWSLAAIPLLSLLLGAATLWVMAE